jgi:glycosyltransferase involved in cell wall biosynthesis
MNKLGKAGQKRIKVEFSWDQIAKRTEDVYDKALQGLEVVEPGL